MKTRSQSGHTTQQQRLFLITDGDNGWVINAVSPSEAQNHFRSEILRLAPEPVAQTQENGWDDYLELEHRTTLSTMTKPCYVVQFHIGKKPYHIETLAFPGQHVAWIPASFN
jgi:hypothetical protein